MDTRYTSVSENEVQKHMNLIGIEKIKIMKQQKMIMVILMEQVKIPSLSCLNMETLEL